MDKTNYDSSKMKHFFIILFLIVPISLENKAAQFRVSNNGNTYSPATLTIQVGDTVNFILSRNCNAVEVSEPGYSKNLFKPNGGFSLPVGGGQVVFRKAGFFYYVNSSPMAKFMKGLIMVLEPISASNRNREPLFIEIVPDAIRDYVHVSCMLKNSEKVSLSLFDALGNSSATLYAGSREKGLWTESFLLPPRMKPGVYFVVLQTTQGKIVKKLMIK
jgi:plastocyanin